MIYIRSNSKLLVADTVLTSQVVSHQTCQSSVSSADTKMAEEVAPAGHGPAIRPAAGATATA